MALITLPRQYTADINGEPRVGARLFVYNAGTNDVRVVYTSKAYTIQHGQPIQSVEGGIFPAIYVDPAGGDYKIVAQTADGAAIYTEDNLPAKDFTSSDISATLDSLVRTPAETAAGVTPVNTAYFPGDVRRYGAVGNGVADDLPAFNAAIASNSYVYVPAPPVEYFFSAQCNVNKSDISIVGVSKRKCRIKLSSAAGSIASVFNWNAYAENVNVERLAFYLKNAGLNQRGLRFEELRSSRIDDCWFEGVASDDDDTTAIQFNGSGTFTGDVTVSRCYITNHLVGIDLQGTCTTVRIRDCELYATGGVTGAKGVKIGPDRSGPLIIGNTFDQWERCVYSEGGFVKQIGNYFESNDPQFEWVRGAGNDRIWNQSIGDTLQGSGVPIYPDNDTDACYVISQPLTPFVNRAYFQARRGFRERGRTFNLGEWVTPAFSAGNFTGNNSMTWTVESGDVVTLAYTLVGTTMTVVFFLTDTVVGGTPSTLLRITIPLSFNGAKRTRNPINVLNDATETTGLAEVQASQPYIFIYKSFAGATWVAGATNVYGQITFEVA